MLHFFEYLLAVIFSLFFCASAYFYLQAPAFPGKILPVIPSQPVSAQFCASSSLSLLHLKDALPLLQNPDRGLRMETYITLGGPESYPGNKQDPYEKLLGFIEKYKEDNPTVVQLYVYLSRYVEKPLDGMAFTQMKKMAELCREHQIRILWRFAYQTESSPDPAVKRILEHLGQIEQWFKANDQLIEDTLFVMQAGLLGYWGEGHSYVNTKLYDIGRIYNRLLSITPEDVFVQTRTASLHRLVAPKYQPRLGMHDDYLIGSANKWSYFEGKSKPEMEKHFTRTINDGEMPWGTAKYFDGDDGHPLDCLDVPDILKQIKQYSLTTLSLEHNYRESGADRIFSMQRWKDVFLTPAQLDALAMPYLPSLFADSGTLSAYDYVRYHLGYLLSITSLELDTQGRQLSLTLQNNGFAAPLNFNALSVVIDGMEYLVDSYDKFTLGSMQAVTYTLSLPDDVNAAALESIGIRLAHCAESGICARFANNSYFRNGIQFIELP